MNPEGEKQHSNRSDSSEMAAQRDLALATRLSQDLESAYIHRKQITGPAQSFVAEREQELLEILASNKTDKISAVLGDLPTHFDNPKILQGFYHWAKANRTLVLDINGAPHRALDAFVASTSRPEGFLAIAEILDDSWLGHELIELSQPLLLAADRDNPSLSEFVYDSFLNNSSESARILAARFLSKLSIEKLLPSLSRDLDNSSLPISSRCLIAEVIGSHPQHDKGVEALLNHIFPYPYDNAMECFNSNLGRFLLRTCTGLGAGMGVVGLVEILLPKNPYLMVELLALGAVFSTTYALRSLYHSLNGPRVENRCEEVQLAAAKGIAHMLLNGWQMNSKIKEELFKALETNLDRVNNHKIAGILRHAMSSTNSYDTEF